MRANGTLPDDPLLHVCVLTFASDLTLLDSVLVRHGSRATTATGSRWRRSITRCGSMRPFRADEWVLYSMKSPAAIGSRGLATGRFFSRGGQHLVSVVQEGMIRVERD